MSDLPFSPFVESTRILACEVLAPLSRLEPPYKWQLSVGVISVIAEAPDHSLICKFIHNDGWTITIPDLSADEDGKDQSYHALYLDDCIAAAEKTHRSQHIDALRACLRVAVKVLGG